MRTCLLLVTLLLTLSCTAQSPVAADSLLARAYATQSAAGMQAFFDQWHATSFQHAVPATDSLSREAMTLLQAFYQPSTASRLHEGMVYRNKHYFILPETINCQVAAQVRESREQFLTAGDTLQQKAWRPYTAPIAADTVQCLLLTPFYDSLLNHFLNTGILPPSDPAGESYRRQKFLHHYLALGHTPDSRHWYFCSEPVVDTITFDPAFRYAIVAYGNAFEGSHAYFKKVHGRWVFLGSKMSWII